jgi:hypothetical protein
MEPLAGLALAVVAFFILKALLPALIRLTRALLALAIVLGGYGAGIAIVLAAIDGGVTEEIIASAVIGIAIAAIAHRLGRWVAGTRPSSQAHHPVADGPAAGSPIVPGHPPPTPPRPMTCFTCGGRGTVPCTAYHAWGEPCGLCGGTRETTCHSCGGRRY